MFYRFTVKKCLTMVFNTTIISSALKARLPEPREACFKKEEELIMKKEGFTSETLVQTPHRNKMIKDLKEGDLVLTLNPKTRTIEIKPIIEVKEFEDWCVKHCELQ